MEKLSQFGTVCVCVCVCVRVPIYSYKNMVAHWQDSEVGQNEEKKKRS